MAYKIVKGAGVSWPVTVQVPVDGGRVEEQGFEIKFRRLTVEQATAAGDLAGVAFVQAVASDWSGVVQESGAPLPFCDAGIIELLDQPHVGAAITNAWISFIQAQPAVREGNSAPPAAPGPAVDVATADTATSPTA